MLRSEPAPARAALQASKPTRARPFELLESKLRPPGIDDRSVPRRALLDKLNGETGAPIVVLCAGPGYGKTTALAQWAESREERSLAWVALDQHDNDPVVLLTYLAAALDRISPIDPGVFEALASLGVSIEARVVPRLGAALSRMPEPVVLVLDDLQTIDNPQCIDAIVALANELPRDSRLALSARDQSALPLGLLRTRALTLELGPEDLRMGEDEARKLLDATPVDFSDDDITELVRRTEGWPAGLYLAALSVGANGGHAEDAGTLTGNDPFVVDFLRSEFLAYLPADELRFLTRTSMLDQMSAPLCDAVLATGGSAALLESLERSNQFVVALDRDREWYRCHPLVRELLAAELTRSEPELVSELLGRAFDWCAVNGQEIAAIAYGQFSGDADRVAAAMERYVQPVFQSGRSATVEQWFDWLEANTALERYPAVAVIGAMFHAVSGSATASERWANAAEQGAHSGRLGDGSESIESWRALLRAVRAREGVAALRADAALAVRTLARDSTWHPAALVLLGMADLLSGSADEADDRFADAAEEAADLGAPDMAPIALAERALAAIGRDEWAAADAFAERAIWIAHRSNREHAAINGLVYAVAARTALHRGRTSRAEELIRHAQRRLPQLTYALPIPSLQTRLELARTYLALADQAGARTMLREVDSLLRRCPGLGTLPEQADELRSALKTAGHNAPGVSTLTAAELRVLPLLTTHLTFKEIGERMFLSRHTVKSHAMSIYRKLEVTSRGAAVGRARLLGLI
jgi:LuxR family maltose regulon positive regulatory protein